MGCFVCKWEGGRRVFFLWYRMGADRSNKTALARNGATEIAANIDKSAECRPTDFITTLVTSQVDNRLGGPSCNCRAVVFVLEYLGMSLCKNSDLSFF
ncbi:hypothetical protein TNIN_96751 [Trichonephila inaurata madagascariensis]|uniref:Uncharacterized protein n=1 Tax=Trichonephila inaurata madagascariensis TaxID=2747483 RepID=A0A8X6IL68_9ARAC|nr:hypothetical protein TNIN_96751 [Trichonephila inaurata madagascariensis]